MWVIGGFSIVSAVLGLFGSARIRCCLALHAIVGFIAGLGQLGLVIYLFVDPSGAVNNIEDLAESEGKDPGDRVEKAVMVGRWVLLGLLILQAVTLVFALVVRRLLRVRAYEEFQDTEAGERAAKREALADLRAKVIGGPPQGSPKKGASDFKIAVAAAAARSELLGPGEGQSLSARVAAPEPAAAGAQSPDTRWARSAALMPRACGRMGGGGLMHCMPCSCCGCFGPSLVPPHDMQGTAAGVERLAAIWSPRAQLQAELGPEQGDSRAAKVK